MLVVDKTLVYGIEIVRRKEYGRTLLAPGDVVKSRDPGTPDLYRSRPAWSMRSGRTPELKCSKHLGFQYTVEGNVAMHIPQIWLVVRLVLATS